MTKVERSQEWWLARARAEGGPSPAARKITKRYAGPRSEDGGAAAEEGARQVNVEDKAAALNSAWFGRDAGGMDWAWTCEHMPVVAEWCRQRARQARADALEEAAQLVYGRGAWALAEDILALRGKP